ncbi:MAG: hypothetical protein IJZ22_07755 [Bacteroidaceae bacterium]|nr:hypothetical protein [Bacteroidaceae bacterium]
MDSLKYIFASLLANIAGLLFPIRNDIFGLVLLFSLNFIVGMFADLSNHRDWSFKKAFCFFRDAAVYFAMVASMYLLGHLKGEEEAAVHCVSFMIYVAIYFYGTNILRNARMLTQEHSTLFRILDFLYYVLSFKVVGKYGCLKSYMELYEKDKKSMVV